MSGLSVLSRPRPRREAEAETAQAGCRSGPSSLSSREDQDATTQELAYPYTAFLEEVQDYRCDNLEVALGNAGGPFGGMLPCGSMDLPRSRGQNCG
jgi:hypothetical protein